MSGGARQRQWRVTATVNGKSFGKFDTFSGGEVTSDSQKYAAGGMDEEEPQGGTATRAEITIGRQYRRDRDIVAHAELSEMVGKGQIVLVRQALDEDKIAVGKPTTFRGILIGCTEPEHDSNGNDPSTFELTIDPERKAA